MLAPAHCSETRLQANIQSPNDDYPQVAPNYAKRRGAIAKETGRGNHGLGLALGQQAAQMIGVVALVGDQPADWSGTIEERGGDRDVVDIARCQHQDARPALIVGQRVELARPAAARGADRLEEGPPFPPAAERCALMCVLSMAAVP